MGFAHGDQLFGGSDNGKAHEKGEYVCGHCEAVYEAERDECDICGRKNIVQK